MSEDLEDRFHNSQAIACKILLAAIELSGSGFSNDEMAAGLLEVTTYFAECVGGKEDRDGIATLLEDLAETLRTEAPHDMTAKPWMLPGNKYNEAITILEHQQNDEGRLPPE